LRERRGEKKEGHVEETRRKARNGSRELLSLLYWNLGSWVMFKIVRALIRLGVLVSLERVAHDMFAWQKERRKVYRVNKK
jgi:hypothetical protein